MKDNFLSSHYYYNTEAQSHGRGSEEGKDVHWHIAFCTSWIITADDINVFKQVLLLSCNIPKNIIAQCELVLEYSLYQGGHLYTILWNDKEIEQGH